MLLSNYKAHLLEFQGSEADFLEDCKTVQRNEN